MECDICFEKFDKSINKPLSLFRCAHTICAYCVKNLPTKDCPTCRRQIEDTAVNWLVFNSIQESEYDHLKAEIAKAIDNKIALEKSLPELIEKKNQDNIDSVKSFKSQIEQEYIDTVKLTTNFKKQTFKRLEKQSKFNTPFTILEQNFEICDFTKLKADIEFQFNKDDKSINDLKKQIFALIINNSKNLKLNDILALSKQDSNNKEMEKVESNDLTKGELLLLKNRLIDENIQLEKKIQILINHEPLVNLFYLL